MGHATNRFAKRLKQIRETAGLTQEQFAKELGVSRGAISYYEIGERTPDIEFLDSLYEYFHFTVPYDFLLGDTDNIKKEHRNMYEHYGLTDLACDHLENVPKRGHIISTILGHEDFSLLENAYDYVIQKYKNFDSIDFNYISFLVTDCFERIIYDSLIALGELNLSDEEKEKRKVLYEKWRKEFEFKQKQWEAEEEQYEKQRELEHKKIEEECAILAKQDEEKNAIRYNTIDSIFDEFVIDELEIKRRYPQT